MTNLLRAYTLSSEGKLVEREVSVSGIIAYAAILPLVTQDVVKGLTPESKKVFDIVRSRGPESNPAKLTMYWTDEGNVAYITPCPSYCE
jgi:hypothetical protein